MKEHTMTDTNQWAESIKSETTYQHSWWVDEKGRLLPREPDPVPCIARVVVKVIFETDRSPVLRVTLDHCRHGGSHGGTDPHMGYAIVPRRLSGGWNSDDPKARVRLFELAQEAAEKAASFYATMVKAWEGTFTEGLKDE